MPYLQLDVPHRYSVEQKRQLARRMGEIYAKQMQADVRRISIAVRELGEGGMWRCGPDEPYPAALLMCDIRRGRPPEQRARLAQALIESCVQILGLAPDRINLEFTQHSGDEMYHPMLGGLSDDWSAAEATGATV
jgi:phenylpyruvate tautomerase PptA (4-oxalocrotonate tautomerase family)